MNNTSTLAPHEILELKELMDSDIICAKKIQSSITIVEDEDLKSYMKRCLYSKKENISQLQSFIETNLNIQ